jgi:hypothetical protein
MEQERDWKREQAIHQQWRERKFRETLNRDAELILNSFLNGLSVKNLISASLLTAYIPIKVSDDVFNRGTESEMTNVVQGSLVLCNV